MLAAMGEQNKLMLQNINEGQEINEEMRNDLKNSVELLDRTIKTAQGLIRPEPPIPQTALSEFSKRIKEQLGEKAGAKKLKHLEAEAWEDFLNMAVGEASLWATRPKGKWTIIKKSQNKDTVKK